MSKLGLQINPIEAYSTLRTIRFAELQKISRNYEYAEYTSYEQRGY